MCKISGRYYFNDNFNYSLYNNNHNVFITSSYNTWCTTFIYKLNIYGFTKLFSFIYDNEEIFITETTMERVYMYFALYLNYLNNANTTLINGDDNFNDGITRP
jgi:hypothetical protein